MTKKNSFIKKIFELTNINDFMKFKEISSTKESTYAAPTNLIEKPNINIFKSKKETENNSYSIESTSNISERTTSIHTNWIMEKEEEKNDDNCHSKKMFYIYNIFKDQLNIILSLKNKEIKIHDISINKKIRMNITEFNKCKEYFSKDKNSNEYKIFEFLEETKQRLIKDYTNNFNLILGLMIKKHKENDYFCTYIFFPPLFPSQEQKQFKDHKINDINSIRSGIDFLIDEINNKKKYSQKEKNNNEQQKK